MKIIKRNMAVMLVTVFMMSIFFVSTGDAIKKTSRLTINKKSITLIVGKKATLKVKGGAKGKVKWKSSNKKIVTVSSKGVVTARKLGTAKITATKAGKKVTCKVKVNKKSDMPIVTVVSTPTVTPTPSATVTPTPTNIPMPEGIDATTAPKIDYIQYKGGLAQTTEFRFTSESVTSQYPNRQGNYTPDFNISIQRLYPEKIKVYVLGKFDDDVSEAMTAEEGAIPENYAGTMADLMNIKNDKGGTPGSLAQDDFIKGPNVPYHTNAERLDAVMTEEESRLPTDVWYIRMNEGGNNRLHQWGMADTHYMVFHFEKGAILGANRLENEEQYVKTSNPAFIP